MHLIGVSNMNIMRGGYRQRTPSLATAHIMQCTSNRPLLLLHDAAVATHSALFKAQGTPAKEWIRIRLALSAATL